MRIRTASAFAAICACAFFVSACSSPAPSDGSAGPGSGAPGASGEAGAPGASSGASGMANGEAGAGVTSLPDASAPADSAAPDGANAPTDSGTPGDANAVGVADAPMDGREAGTTLTCDVFKYGAKGDGKTTDTAAIQAAIDACAAAGGGTVLAHNGTFLSGMIRLKANIVFHLDTTATLLGTQVRAAYPDTNPPTFNTQRKQAVKALVYAEGVDNIRIEGGGTINGQGAPGSPWNGPEALRPMAIFTVLSTHVTIQNISIKDSAMWDLVSMEDDYVAIAGVNIDSRDLANRDGIDIVDCHHVTIDNCHVTSGDDSICIKSGVRRGVDDLTVRNCTVQSIGANAIKFGTGSYGSCTNAIFDTVTINGAKNSAMSVEAVDGADVKNIAFRNVTFQNVGGAFLVVLGNRGIATYGGWPSNDVRKTGSLDTVHFENVTGSNEKNQWGSLITGTPTERVKNISFTNVHMATLGGVTAVPSDPPEYTTQYPSISMFGNEPAYGYFIRHADGVSFTASTVTASPNDVRKPIESRDVTGLTVQ